MLQQALQKLNSEIGAADKKNIFVPAIGGFLINHVRSNPDHAELIMTDGKTIAGSLSAMEAEARKHMVNGRAMLTDEEGFNIVLQYFGVKVNKPVSAVAVTVTVPDFNVSLDDLL